MRLAIDGGRPVRREPWAHLRQGRRIRQSGGRTGGPTRHPQSSVLPLRPAVAAGDRVRQIRSRAVPLLRNPARAGHLERHHGAGARHHGRRYPARVHDRLPGLCLPRHAQRHSARRLPALPGRGRREPAPGSGRSPAPLDTGDQGDHGGPYARLRSRYGALDRPPSAFAQDLQLALGLSSHRKPPSACRCSVPVRRRPTAARAAAGRRQRAVRRARLCCRAPRRGSSALHRTVRRRPHAI